MDLTSISAVLYMHKCAQLGRYFIELEKMESQLQILQAKVASRMHGEELG